MYILLFFSRLLTHRTESFHTFAYYWPHRPRCQRNQCGLSALIRRKPCYSRSISNWPGIEPESSSCHASILLLSHWNTKCVFGIYHMHVFMTNVHLIFKENSRLERIGMIFSKYNFVKRYYEDRGMRLHDKILMLGGGRRNSC